jgi:SAM-dependent methyltransferase
MTIEEIKIANSTYRRCGSSVFDKDGNVRSVVARYVEKNIGKDKKILDYGCGSEFIQGNYLRQKGFDVDGWDIGTNKPKNCVSELRQIYDVVYASNVLNVISSSSMLKETLNQIYSCLKTGGVFIANYPSAPRKMRLDAEMMDTTLENFFKSNVTIVGGTKSAPIWCVVKS